MKILWTEKLFDTNMALWPMAHICDELTRHGIELYVFDILKFSSPIESNEALLELVRKEHFDLFVTAYNEYDIFIDTVKAIKQCGVPTLLMCYDNIVIPYEHLKVAPFYDLVWLTARETKWMFDKGGCHTILLPYAANPNLALYKGEEIGGIGFVGTPYGSRANIINAFLDGGIEVFCHYISDDKASEPIKYQNNAPDGLVHSLVNLIKFKEGRKLIAGKIVNAVFKKSRLHVTSEYFHPMESCSPEQVYTLYGRYSVCLSSTAARNTGVLKHPVNVINLRDFEIPMACGLQFCQYSAELAEYFEEDKEIVFYRTEEEMLDKARYLLADKQISLRNTIKTNARRRAENEHTWYCRFYKVFQKLGIKE